MTDQTTALIPDLDSFETYYGIRIATVGEDGNMVALEHVDRRRFVAAHIRYYREIFGDSLPNDIRSPELAFDGIEHTWMVNNGKDDTDWHLELATADTASAFPVTYWRSW